MTTVSVPAAALTLTGYAPTVSTPRTIAVPAGSLSLTGRAPAVYFLGSSTDSTVYLPVRAYAQAESQSVDQTTDIENLRSLLPSQRQAVVNPDGTMRADWYRFFDYLVNVYLGGPGAPTVSDIVASVTATLESQAAQSEAVALIAAQSQTNAEALAAVVQVAQDNALSGSDQIPRVSQTYLEP